MNRCRCLFLSLGTIAVGLTVGVWLLRPEPPRTAITRGNAAKIEDGMTLAEVEAVLGGPARDETTGPVMIFCATLPSLDNATTHWWMTDEVFVVVCCDNNAGVVYSECRTACRVDESLLDMLRRWLRL